MTPISFEVIPLASVPQDDVTENGQTEKPVLLIVDDEPLVADTLSVILSREGFSVMKAYNAASALRQAALRTPHLMVTDVAMPGMNGIDLAVTMQQVCPTCKVLLFSGHNASGKILAASGQEFRLLTKPVHPTKLVTYISRELGLPEPTYRTAPPRPTILYRESA